MTSSPFIVAFDCHTLAAAKQLADQLSPQLCRAKVGKELFTACGMSVVEMLHRKGFEVFLDLKFHDIPNTVAGAVAVAANAGVWMVNVHSSGGQAMMQAAREAVDANNSTTLLIGVTLLTSIDESALAMLGVERSLKEQVGVLASLAQRSGLDGVVCSAQEATDLKAMLGSEFLLVTPGIRTAENAADDQRRIMTPVQALQAGSDYMVVGRPITQASDPALALQQFVDQLPD